LYNDLDHQTRKRQILADLALLGVAFIWGITFTVVKVALNGIGPYYFLGLRFFAAFIFLALVYARHWRLVNKQSILAGVTIGIFLFGGYAFQTVGLKYTSAASAGFITGMSVVLVPLIVILTSRRLPGPTNLIGAGSAAVGLAALTLQDNLTFSNGDTLVFFCAVSFALHIILVGRYVLRFDPIALTIIQIGTVAVASLIGALTLEEIPQVLNREVWVALIITAIPATALAFMIQNRVQCHTSPNHTAIIFTTEPVFAALYACIPGGEVLSARQWAGCLLIIVGMLVAELKSDA